MSFEAGMDCNAVVVSSVIPTPPSVPTISEVFAMVTSRYPGLDLKLASGGLEDANGISDVDISFVYDPVRASGLFDQILDVKTKANHTIYSLGGFPREVNVFVTLDETLAMRAVIHRENELYINKSWPGLAKEAFNYKRMGIPTEQAYAYAIGLVDIDPYEGLLNQEIINNAVKAKQKRIMENWMC
jgi:hypothetical protein